MPTVSCGSQSLLRIDSAAEMRSIDALDQNGCINIHKIREVIGGWVNNGRDWLYETLSARETSRNAFRIIRNTFSSTNDQELRGFEDCCSVEGQDCPPSPHVQELDHIFTNSLQQEEHDEDLLHSRFLGFDSP